MRSLTPESDMTSADPAMAEIVPAQAVYRPWRTIMLKFLSYKVSAASLLAWHGASAAGPQRRPPMRSAPPPAGRRNRAAWPMPGQFQPHRPAPADRHCGCAWNRGNRPVRSRRKSVDLMQIVPLADQTHHNLANLAHIRTYRSPVRPEPARTRAPFRCSHARTGLTSTHRIHPRKGWRCAGAAGRSGSRNRRASGAAVAGLPASWRGGPRSGQNISEAPGFSTGAALRPLMKSPVNVIS